MAAPEAADIAPRMSPGQPVPENKALLGRRRSGFVFEVSTMFADAEARDWLVLRRHFQPTSLKCVPALVVARGSRFASWVLRQTVGLQAGPRRWQSGFVRMARHCFASLCQISQKGNSVQ